MSFERHAVTNFVRIYGTVDRRIRLVSGHPRSGTGLIGKSRFSTFLAPTLSEDIYNRVPLGTAVLGQMINIAGWMAEYDSDVYATGINLRTIYALTSSAAR